MLARVLDFILDVNECAGVEELRRVVPAGLGRLIDCDRASVNEVDISPDRRDVVPTPVPEWWKGYGQVYLAHATDHPALGGDQGYALNRPICLDDPAIRVRWSKSVLHHEYFEPLRIRHQLSALVSLRRTTLVAVALNRTARGFTMRERLLLKLICPHIQQALELRDEMGECASPESMDGDTRATEPELISVNPDSGRVRMLSETADRSLRGFLSRKSVFAAGNSLSEEARSWLREQIAMRATEGILSLAPPRPFVQRGREGTIVLRLVNVVRGSAVLAVQMNPGGFQESRGEWCQLTVRESEVLGWIGDGKRNAEIARILGVSPRTVEKHVEHVLDKLHVENRATAIRRMLEARRERRTIPDA